MIERVLKLKNQITLFCEKYIWPIYETQNTLENNLVKDILDRDD